MQTFAEWLDAQLAERGWNAADLTRASQTLENPRGLDSGLISRWRRHGPLGAVPTQAQTLARLARAFNLPESEVYRAAGLPVDAVPVGHDLDDDADRSARKLANALRRVPHRFWGSVVDASVALANAYQAVGSVSDPSGVPVSEPGRIAKRERPRRVPRLPSSQPHPERLVAFA